MTCGFTGQFRNSRHAQRFRPLHLGTGAARRTQVTADHQEPGDGVRGFIRWREQNGHSPALGTADFDISPESVGKVDAPSRHHEGIRSGRAGQPDSAQMMGQVNLNRH